MILDKFKLDGKKAVITGGSKGIGKAYTIGLAQAGADVLVVSRTDNPELKAEVEALGRVYHHHPADLTDRDQTKGVIPAAAEALGGLDILVNNAGINRRHPVTEFPDEDWDTVIEIQLSASFVLTREALKIMVQQGHGKVINTASLMSFQGGIMIPAYAAAKHGVAGLTKAMANGVAAQGVQVNAIAPGFFATDLTQALQDDPERYQGIINRTPAGRWGEPEELAGACVFLASDAADFVTGTLLAVDGGWLSW